MMLLLLTLSTATTTGWRQQVTPKTFVEPPESNTVAH